MVGFVVLVLMGCSPVEPKASPTAPEDPVQSSEGLVTTVANTTLVGVVHEGGTRLCTDPHKVHWVERTWAVGFVPLVHEPGLSEAIAKLEGRVVKVSGVATDEPTTVHEGDPRPKETVMCGGAQMRSDWELWPDGIRVHRGEGPDLTAFRIEAIEVVEPLRAALRGDEVFLSVTNPFEHELENATLVAHYEGCYGKPGTASERRPLGAIQPGATLEDVPVPQLKTRETSRGQDHRLDSVQLIASVAQGALDLDVDLDALGLNVECPKRR